MSKNYKHIKPSLGNPNRRTCEIFFDGSCRPNPGQMQIGVKLTSKEFSTEVSKKIGSGTNNVAELSAAMVGIQLAAMNGFDQVLLKGDSKLTINSISGEWSLKDSKLIPILGAIRKLSKNMTICTQWIPREDNESADELSTK